MERIKEVNQINMNYGLHSLRSGGDTAASENDVSDRLISKHGRWNSDNSKNGYIKVAVKKRLKVSKSLRLKKNQ